MLTINRGKFRLFFIFILFLLILFKRMFDFCLSLHQDQASIYMFVNVIKCIDTSQNVILLIDFIWVFLLRCLVDDIFGLTVNKLESFICCICSFHSDISAGPYTWCVGTCISSNSYEICVPTNVSCSNQHHVECCNLTIPVKRVCTYWCSGLL